MVDVKNILMELIKAHNREELKVHTQCVLQGYPKLHELSNTTSLCDDEMFHEHYYGVQEHLARYLLPHFLMQDALAHPPTNLRKNAY
jgi:hypothetical protein